MDPFITHFLMFVLGASLATNFLLGLYIARPK